MAGPTPRALVHKALSRRRYISNTPTIPQPAYRNTPREQLYNFGDVGGLAPRGARPLTREQWRDQEGATEQPAAVQSAQMPPIEAQPADTMLAANTSQSEAPEIIKVDPAKPSASSVTEEELSKLMEERAKIAGTEVVDDDSKLMNFWKGSQFAIRQVQRQGGDLGATVGALIGGGLRGIFTKTEDDVRDRDEKVTKLDKKIETAQKRNDAELERQAKALSNQKKKVEVAIDVRKLTADPIWDLAVKMKELTPAMADALEKAGYPKLPPAKWQELKDQWVNGTLMQRGEFDTAFKPNASAGTKPDEQITQFDTGAGQFPVTNKDAARMGSDITAANIAAQNRTNIENTNNQIQVSIKNAEMTNQYNLQSLNRRLDAIKAAGSTLQDAGKLQGIAAEMQAKATQLAEFERAMNDPNSYGKAKETAQKNFDKANEEYGELTNKFDAQAGQVQGGASISQYLNSLPPLPRPTLITAPTVEPVLNKGRAVPKSKDPLGIFQD